MHSRRLASSFSTRKCCSQTHSVDAVDSFLITKLPQGQEIKRKRKSRTLGANPSLSHLWVISNKTNPGHQTPKIKTCISIARFTWHSLHSFHLLRISLNLCTHIKNTGFCHFAVVAHHFFEHKGGTLEIWVCKCHMANHMLSLWMLLPKNHLRNKKCHRASVWTYFY